jgi:hypothetical protein
MGGDASKCGGVKIVLEKYVFCPGEIIRGSINFIINEKFPSCSLILCFKGQEEVSWFEREATVNGHVTTKKFAVLKTKRNDHFEIREIHYYNRNTISKTRYSIMEWSDSLNPGSYSVPFTFQLPDTLPSSFRFMRERLIFTVIYKIYARLKSSRTKVGDKQEISIYSHYDVPRPIEHPISSKLVSWCCLPKGSVTLSIDWRNDKYTPEVPIQCVLNIDNSNSSGYVMEVKAKGYYVINAIAQKRETIKNEVFRSTYPVQVHPGGKITGESGQAFAFDLKQSQKELDVMNVHSMKGMILECSFYIEFEMVYDVKCLCCGDTPKITTLFFVRPNNRFTVPQFVPPMQWSPYMFNPISISYQPAYEVNDKGQSQMWTQFNQGNRNNMTTL